MSGVPRIALQQLLKEGTKTTEGLDEVVYRNTKACTDLAEMTRTSFGPCGLNKMISTSHEKLFVTKDAATMVHQMDVEHPAAAIMVGASINQSIEFGDGTNLVLMLAGELLRRAESLMRQGLNPSEVVSGYERAAAVVFDEIPKLIHRTVTSEEMLDKTSLAALIHPVIGAKHADFADLLSGLAAEAFTSVCPANPAAVDLDNIRVAKVPGQSPAQSFVVDGMVLQRESETQIKTMKAYTAEEAEEHRAKLNEEQKFAAAEAVEAGKLRIAVYGGSIEPEMTETKSKVLLENAAELEGFAVSEENRMRAQVQQLVDMGIRVVVSGTSIADIAAHYLSLAGIMAFRIPSKFELRRFARTVGAHINVTWCVPRAETLGFARSIDTIELGGGAAMLVRPLVDAAKGGCATIVLRAATKSLLDDLERALDSGVSAARTLAKDGRLVPGAGACETALSTAVRIVGEKERSLDQYAIREFAGALEVVPRTLAETAGLNATASVAALHAAQAEGRMVGVNIDATHPTEAPMCPLEAGIVDAAAAKEWAIRLAVEAATTVCRIDQVIRSRKAGGPKPRAPNARDQA